ncbi:MAG: type III-B CRISPR module-associated protein Cmr3, partial [Deinococcota bacterium]|nr:type III-B CRISPR module-associated protein Cmr3 [Deinococcota bacterium]
WRTPGGSLPGLPGEIISACVGKPVMIGGWDSEKRKPKELVPHLPAGSVWFVEAEASEVAAAKQRHGGHIGEKTAWGYGQILIGAW